MYAEELVIDRYKRAQAIWEQGTDEYKAENPEPEKPQILLDREYEEWIQPQQVPDIMDMMGNWE